MTYEITANSIYEAFNGYSRNGEEFSGVNSLVNFDEFTVNESYSNAADAVAYFSANGSRILVCFDTCEIIMDIKKEDAAADFRMVIRFPESEVVREIPIDPEEINLVKMYRDVERDTIISENELRKEFNTDMHKRSEYRSYDHYITACMTWEGGTLEHYNEEFPGGLNMWNWEPRRMKNEGIAELRACKFGNDPAAMMIRYTAMELCVSEFLVYEDCLLSRDEVEYNSYICDDRLYLNNGDGYTLQEDNILSYFYIHRAGRVCCAVYHPSKDNYTYWLVH